MPVILLILTPPILLWHLTDNKKSAEYWISYSSLDWQEPGFNFFMKKNNSNYEALLKISVFQGVCVQQSVYNHFWLKKSLNKEFIFSGILNIPSTLEISL